MGHRHRHREAAGGLPAFVRDPAALPELALMGRELDRSKGAGETRDRS
jgi:hypothetical protein